MTQPWTWTTPRSRLTREIEMDRYRYIYIYRKREWGRRGGIINKTFKRILLKTQPILWLIIGNLLFF